MQVEEKFPSVAIADQLGISWILTPNFSGPGWTGDTLIVESTNQWGDLLFWHEICHWLAATPEQRQHPDYGIGRNVDAPYDLNFWSSNSRESVDGESWNGFYIGFDEAYRQEALAVDGLVWYPFIVDQFDNATLKMTYGTASDFGAFDATSTSEGYIWHFDVDMQALLDLFKPLNLDEAEVRAWPKRFRKLYPDMPVTKRKRNK